MTDIINLNDLFIEQAREIYNAEKQQLEIFNDLLKNIRSKELHQAVKEHVDITKEHVNRLESVFNMQHELVSGEHNQTMKGILREMIETINRSADPEVCDAGIIASLQQVEHFQIALYGTICSFAKALKKEKIATTLLTTLNEELAFDTKLTRIAKDTVNVKAITALIS